MKDVYIGGVKAEAAAFLYLEEWSKTTLAKKQDIRVYELLLCFYIPFVCVYNHNPSSTQKGCGVNFCPHFNTVSLCILFNIGDFFFLTNFNGYDKFWYCDLTFPSL